ncbi:MAG: hypothetical protein LBH18_04890 [Spirochaetaceae bacterium]|jgi:hypothetical protein|nr:hypothetical protein [Spirochaetaceae bacterium]
MQHKTKRKFFARVSFFAGIVLLLLGSIFLLFSFAPVTHLQIIGSFFVMIIGGLCILLAIKLKRQSLYLFFAAFFLLLGLFFLFKVLGVITLTLKQSWPLISVFAGAALLPAGIIRYGSIKRIYLIPSIALAGLGAFLMPFSLKLTNFSFREFMISWCPVIIIMAGVILLLLSLNGNKERT